MICWNWKLIIIVLFLFFYRLIPEGGLPSEKPDSVKKVIFCTGKVYYDLTKARAAGELESDIAISRVEQICPFPFDLGTCIYIDTF